MSMSFKKLRGLITVLIVLLQTSFFGRIYADVSDCYYASNSTLFSTSTQYVDAYYELFDGGPAWQNFVHCQESILNASAAYSETCELDREQDSMFTKFLNACKESGGTLYVQDDAFQCSKVGITVNVTEKNVPHCILPELSSCEGFETYVALLFIDPETYASYTDLGYSCKGMLFDVYPYEDLGTGPTIADQPVKTDPPITVETDPPISELGECLSKSNETLSSISPEYADAYSKLYASDILWQNFQQCKNYFLEASEEYDGACVYNWEYHSIFNTYVVLCQEAGGTVYIEDAAFECSKEDSIITITDRNQPYCLFPEATYCEVLQNLELTMKPESYADFTENDFFCQGTLLKLYPLEPNDPDPDVDEFDACISASNETLFSQSAQYAEAYSEMFNGDQQSDDWINCQINFINKPLGNDETCDYDYSVNSNYDTYVDECQKAGGIVYLSNRTVECKKTGRKINVAQKKNPFCILAKESTCKEIQDYEHEFRIPLSVDYKDAGYSCSFTDSIIYTLENSNDPAPVNNTNNTILNEEANNGNGNLPIAIGIIVPIIVAIISIITFVFYGRHQRKRSQMESNARNSSNVKEQEDLQKKRMDAMTAAIQAAANPNAVYESTAPPYPCAPYSPPTTNVAVSPSVAVAQPIYYNYGKEDE